MQQSIKVVLTAIIGTPESHSLWPRRKYRGGAPELVNQLAQHYITPDTTFAPNGAPQGYIIHITAESIYVIGPWSE